MYILYKVKRLYAFIIFHVQNYTRLKSPKKNEKERKLSQTDRASTGAVDFTGTFSLVGKTTQIQFVYHNSNCTFCFIRTHTRIQKFKGHVSDRIEML